MIGYESLGIFSMTLARQLWLWVAAGIALAAVPVWAVWVGPALLQTPSDFHLTADIYSLDNFYDEARHEFLGEQGSVTTYSYQAITSQPGVLLVKNVFDVRTVDGEKIFSVERHYGIDPRTGRHVLGFGDRDRDGYLFAPRHLRRGEPFTTWHINYDGPAHLRFAGEERLYGLPVYRYETRYEGVRIDQTVNLGHLPGVPETRGVELEPYLQLWVEPATGSLVAYRDETTAYYYDIVTGVRLHPWNRFTNSYTRESIAQRVANARLAKVRQSFIEWIAPLALLALAGVLIAASVQWWAALILLLVGMGVVTAVVVTPVTRYQREMPMRVGIARWQVDPAYEQTIQAFKDALAFRGYREGASIIYLEPGPSGDPERHRATIDSLVRQGVELIYAVDAPSALAAQAATDDTPVVFSLVTHPVELGLVASLQRSGNNLAGTRDWVPASEQLSLMLQLVPSLRRLGVVYGAGQVASTLQVQELASVARRLRLGVVDLPIASAEGVAAALAAGGAVDALYLACDPLLVADAATQEVVAFARRRRLPSFSCLESGVRLGSLAGVVSDFTKSGQLAGEKAGLILSGIPPSALGTSSVPQPITYINQSTAAVLGIEVPAWLRRQATVLAPEPTR